MLRRGPVSTGRHIINKGQERSRLCTTNLATGCPRFRYSVKFFRHFTIAVMFSQTLRPSSSFLLEAEITEIDQSFGVTSWHFFKAH